MNRSLWIITVCAAAALPLGGLHAAAQVQVRGGIFFEAEDYDECHPGQENFGAIAYDAAASDGHSVYRFHKGTVTYRFKVEKPGRYRVWVRYGAPGDARMQAAMDPPNLGALSTVDVPSTGGCVGPGVWRWAMVAQGDLAAGPHVLALGTGAVRPDCVFMSADPRVRPSDKMLSEVEWPPGPRLPELAHDRTITQHPKWLRSAWRICYAHSEWNREITIEEWCRRAAEGGAQVVCAAGEIPAGTLNGRLTLVPVTAKALPEGYQVDYSWVKRYADAAHKHGLKYLCYVNSDRTLDPLLLEHPEWRQFTSNGMPFRGWGSWCSPYKAAFIDRLVAIARDSRFDGIMIDMPFVGPPGGDCSTATVHAFRQRFGVDPPRRRRLKDPLYQRWVDFQCWIREQWLLELTEALHEVNPECAVTINQTRGWIFDIAERNFLTTRVGQCVDGLLEEEGWETQHQWKRPWAWPIQSAWQNLFLHCRTRPGIGMMWHVTYNMPTVEAECQAYAMLANGVAPSVTTGGNWPVMRKIWAHTRACEPWVTDAALVPWAAIHFSEDTLAWYANAEGEDATHAYIKNVFGLFQAALELHLPIEIITDDDVADVAKLRRYGTVILPNSACLSDRQAQALAAYVDAGGGLVATYETGCYDSFGARRERPALAEAFGVEQGERGLGIAYSMPLRDLGHPILDHPEIKRSGYWSQGLIEPRLSGRLYIGPGTRKVGAVQTRVRAPNLSNVPLSGSWRLRQGPLKPAKGWHYRTLHARPHGKGKVAFFPIDLGHAYFCYNHPLPRTLIGQALRWTSGQPCPIETDAPMLVESVLWAKGRVRLVHLLNDVSSFGRSAAPNPEAFGGFRAEVLPVHDVSLTVSGAYGKATVYPGAGSLDAKARDGKTTVVVPRLRIHQMVVLEP